MMLLSLVLLRSGLMLLRGRLALLLLLNCLALLLLLQSRLALLLLLNYLALLLSRLTLLQLRSSLIAHLHCRRSPHIAIRCKRLSDS